MNHKHLPPERKGRTHRAIIADTKVYIRTGEYLDGKLGEVFISIDKEGSELRLLDAAAICISAGLQRGVPLSAFTSKLRGQRVGTGGITDDEQQPLAASIVDYLAQWLERKYPAEEDGTKTLEVMDNMIDILAGGVATLSHDKDKVMTGKMARELAFREAIARGDE